MDVYGLAREMLGEMTLDTDQVAALRALDHEFWQRVYTQRQGRAGRTDAAERELRDWATGAIRAILTPEQRRALDD